jgi:hypothetical protein
MHLVDDDVLHAAQRFAGLAGEQQVERFRGGDQDLRRVLDQLAPRLCRRVTRARCHSHLRQNLPKALRGAPDAGQRRAQVALHVVRQRLER